MVRGRGQHHLLRRQADQLRAVDGHALRAGQPRHRVEDHVQRRLRGVEQVHAHLRLPLDEKALGLHRRQPAAALANRLGNGRRDLHIVAAQVDVVRHEKRPRTDHHRARRSHLRRAEVGCALGLVDALHQRLELAAADVGQPPPFRARGGRRIEIDRKL